MLDCGIHPGLSGMDALPFVDMIAADQVEINNRISVDPVVSQVYTRGLNRISGDKMPAIHLWPDNLS